MDKSNENLAPIDKRAATMTVEQMQKTLASFYAHIERWTQEASNRDAMPDRTIAGS